MSTPIIGALPVVAVLAGGASRRMGRDKAMIELGGRSLLARIVDEARHAGLDVVVVGRSAQQEVEGARRWIADEQPGEGPLAALATALRALEREVILVACDMPWVDREALAWLAMATLDDDSDGLVVRHQHVVQPLFARYRTSCLEHADVLLHAGERSLGALIDRCRFVAVDAPAWLGERLANINTPEELDGIAGAS